ncbi:MAG TPA: hypothetical protein VF886_18130, partial [Roseiarcus sp.]
EAAFGVHHLVAQADVGERSPLMLAARARALVDGRLSPSLDDVAMLAEPALKHRMALSFAARAEGETVSAVIARLVAKTIQ